MYACKILSTFYTTLKLKYLLKTFISVFYLESKTNKYQIVNNFIIIFINTIQL